jgi:protein ImuB
VRTLGQFIALPKADIARRLGTEGIALHDLARGGKDRLLRLVRPPQVWHEEVELEAPIECLEPLMHLLNDMLGRLCDRLAQAWRVAGSLRLQLRFDDRTTHQRHLHIAEPTRDAAVLLRLMETALENLKAAAPIIFVALRITPVRAAASQGCLFDQGLRDPNRFAETLSAIEALLGKGRVGRAELLPSRRTDACRVSHFLEAPAPSAARTASGLPLQRFRPPLPAHIVWHDLRPALLHLGRETKPLIATSGPWYLSGEWWDAQQSWQHEIWDAATEDGTLYRLVRDQNVWRVEGRWG